eukprot:CAMPEP_0174287854 /NCGR_PEP_ID=MMETSP0809-20121228/17937_1 /TAXON_ID=73025 ORGANISM="Eutreptiella gymnastica-like, Strain CCMP1594" /NCGR_SAMPLE_ID=MMETSP0809 /ASSEMBLY_ACC=CAM_ASM_000658 /LENGTH=67 /DNA_ID=CAMNT_0015384651 /DNA_START=122 /DNA_END=325 /DNA_ORIENTATION=-
MQQRPQSRVLAHRNQYAPGMLLHFHWASLMDGLWMASDTVLQIAHGGGKIPSRGIPEVLGGTTPAQG